ncbi:hypothetical protein [Stutzerimonas stutzeri]|uniref:Uncharacterized protein n=1 Tax=Stutzerimonas stutzeri TaxID=316 RepID=A0A2N8R8X4_STUST|nr:hypothetical protein [Stutzerimonas stutzeri]MCQ4256266.1 hypothetical protein [Stutzerimonas stutzeri]PNF57542.1 hypothetical protein CXK99_21215 [Stutzerimonas stutzeri]
MEENELSVALAKLNDRAVASELVLREETKQTIVLLFEFAQVVVEKYKAARTEDQERNPNFRFWSHICSVELGVTAVTVRWRKYSGTSKFSTPIESAQLTEFRLPASVFRKCTKTEKKAIMEAECNFAIVRKISGHLGKAIESAIAIKGITNTVPDLPTHPVDPEERRILDALAELDNISRKHSEMDKAAVRRLLGL